MSRSHNALYAGDVEGQIGVLRDVGMCKSIYFGTLVLRMLTHLLIKHSGYLTAKRNRLAGQIPEAAGLTEVDVDERFFLRYFPSSHVTPITDINLLTVYAGTSSKKPSQTVASRGTMFLTSMISTLQV
jgi:hypothetical protein